MTQWYETAKELFPYRVVLRAETQAGKQNTLEIVVIAEDSEDATGHAKKNLSELSKQQRIPLDRVVVLESGPCGTNAIGCFREVES